ncbi:RING finger protein 141-like [Homalodisca vitripennis]|uniref:RING finger protein 141-like n=1 Tax=Homalodisca vitripennis TaxID=197043 RepID=UPI001EEA6600|nr:RING finger protein 141-like [Homalodisca vitripennis]XP_046665121.1 RING finger protein 141-like [Homalodisca vitripennis]XP_046665122.1 RING finger protein 141-like [Homalodisca vitripennis]
MGQSLSSDLDSVDNLPDELFRQARHLSEVATLTYEEFQEYLKQLNELSQKCMDSEGKQLVFAVKEGSDASVLWKGTIRIACVKIDPATKNVETYRLLNLNQFLKVYKSMSSQCAAAQEGSTADPSTSDIKQLTTSVLLRHVSGQTSDSAAECCICLERRPDMLLPCAHAYCRPCIEQWSVNHKTCPICREEANNDEAWVMSEAPNSLEMSEEICSTLMELVERQPSTDDTDDSH